MKKKKSIIILTLSVVVVSLVSYIAFAANDDGGKSPLEYGLFASENIFFDGSGCDITADIWADKYIGFYGASFTIRGNTWSKNDIDIKNDSSLSGSGIQNNYTQLNLSGTKNKTTATKGMIDIMDTIIDSSKADGNYDDTLKYLDISKIKDEDTTSGKAFIVKGDISGGVGNKNLNNYLIADGNIDIKLDNYKGKQDISNIRPIVMASRKNVTITGGPIIVGTIYAPNGTVLISGNTVLIGNIIAKNIVIRGADLYINDEKRVEFKKDL